MPKKWHFTRVVRLFFVIAKKIFVPELKNVIIVLSTSCLTWNLEFLFLYENVSFLFLKKNLRSFSLQISKQFKMKNAIKQYNNIFIAFQVFAVAPEIFKN